MTQIIGLFSNQKKAVTAVKELTQAGLGEHDIHVIEERNKTKNEYPAVQMAANSNAAILGETLTSNKTALKRDFGKEEIDYLNRILQKGGVLVVVDLADNAYASIAKKILDENGGKVAAS